MSQSPRAAGAQLANELLANQKRRHAESLKVGQERLAELEANASECSREALVKLAGEYLFSSPPQTYTVHQVNQELSTLEALRVLADIRTTDLITRLQAIQSQLEDGPDA